MQRTFILGPYSIPSLVLTGATRAGLAAANALEIANSRVRRVRGLPYARDARHRLDVYVPASAAHEPWPVAVFLHGGNWTYFGREHFRFVGSALAERGCIAVLPSFRCFPHCGLDEQLLDAAHAVRWTRRHAREFGGDPARLHVAGHSSGAHLASLLALDPHRLARVGGGPGWLAGFVGIGGPYWLSPVANPYMADFFGPAHRYASAQPVRFAARGAPRTLLVHGLADRMVRPQNSRELARRLRAAGVAVQLELIEGHGHATALEGWVRTRRARDPLLATIERFVTGEPAPYSRGIRVGEDGAHGERMPDPA
jgi:acetyl esterase/lipase